MHCSYRMKTKGLLGGFQMLLQIPVGRIPIQWHQWEGLGPFWLALTAKTRDLLHQHCGSIQAVEFEVKGKTFASHGADNCFLWTDFSICGPFCRVTAVCRAGAPLGSEPGAFLSIAACSGGRRLPSIAWAQAIYLLYLYKYYIIYLYKLYYIILYLYLYKYIYINNLVELPLIIQYPASFFR